MSEKFRNELRPGFTINFSKYYIQRYIIIDDDRLNKQQKNEFVSKINEVLWKEIQEVNMLETGRILPFVKVCLVEEVNNELRVIINDIESNARFEDYDSDFSQTIPIESLSHLINFKTVSPRRQIEVSDLKIPGSAKMIINPGDQICAAVDIFMDIAMFHSFDSLNKFKLDQRKKFSINKYKFIEKNNLNSYYECNLKKPPFYWSLAFSVRDSNKKIDHFAYVKLWDLFLKQYYPEISKGNSSNESVPTQLGRHRDIDNLDKKFFEESYWSTMQKGDYIFCRINKDPNDNKRRMILEDLFSIDKFYIGAVSIFPVSQYGIEFFNRELRELNVSAFKIVI